MLKIIQTWVQRYFSNEEAVVLLFLLIASFVVVITMGKMLAPVIASVILAYLMQGLVSKLEKIKIPHLLAVTLVFTFFVSLFLMLLLFVVPSVWNQSIKLLTEMPQKIDQLQTLMLLLPERYPDLISPERLQEWINLASQELAKLGQWAVSFSLSSIPNLVALLVYFVLVPMLVFFFLKDRKIIGQRLAALLPAENKLMLRIGQEMNLQIANYIRGKVLEIFIVGGVTFVVFTILGLNYAALLALIVGFSVLVPYIGATMATVPVAIIAYLQWGFGSEFLYVIVAYSIIQALDGNLLVPILFSEAVNLHPVAIIVAVLVFGGLWGFWGVFFAIPLATLLKAVFNAWPRKRPVELHGHDSV